MRNILKIVRDLKRNRDQISLAVGILLVGTGICCDLSRKQDEKIITINEVIPEATIISEVDGIIEYQGVRFFLGTDHLLKKKALIESLKLRDLGNPAEVDMRFSRQIIIRERQ